MSKLPILSKASDSKLRCLGDHAPDTSKHETDTSDGVTVRTASGSKTGIIVLLFFSLLGLLVALSVVASDYSAGGDWSYQIVSATLTWMVLYIAASYYYYRSLYLLSNAYLLAFFMFHLGLIYTVALYSDEMSMLADGSRSYIYETAGWYVVVSLCAFGVGFSLSVLTGKRLLYPDDIVEEFRVKTNRFLFIQGIGLAVAAVIFLIMAIASYGNILAYSRAELFNLTADSRGFGVFMMVLPGAVTLLALSAQSKKQKIVTYSLALFVVLVIMLSGYRSAALFPALVAVILWVKSGRNIPVVIAVSGMIGILLAISVIGVFRTMGTYEQLGSEQLSESYEKASIRDSFIEMGSSVGVLAEVINIVPESEPFRYGYSYWMSLREMLPNIGLTIDASKSRASKLGEAMFDQDALTKMAPADWITYKLNRWKFDNGQGLGFSAIAEPYLNFGVTGVVVYFLVLGFILSRLDLKEMICHPYLYLFSACIFWTLIRTVRNDFSNFTKPMGFIIVILVIWNIGLAIIGKNIKFTKLKNINHVP